jgi:hypothetical protein
VSNGIPARTLTEMRLHVATHICSLCLILSPIASVVKAVPPDSVLTDTPIHSLSEDEMLPFLLDSDEETNAAVWDWMQDFHGTTHLRTRVMDPGNQEYPAHQIRITLNHEQIRLGTMLVRNAGEPDAADLWRIGLETHRSDLTIVAGDFRVDQQLGWTVSSSPAWSSTTDAFSPLRRPSASVRMNLTSEAGYGWRGIALAYGDPESAGPVRMDLWGGYASFEGRYDDDGLLIPYSTQGDHSAGRVDLPTENSLHTGTNVTAALPASLGELQFTAAATRFENSISPESESARFRFASNEFHAVGLGWSWADESMLQSLQTEVSRQSTGAWGGAVVASSRIQESAHIVAHAWRATKAFSTSQARPSLGFGTDPAGVTGSQLAVLVDRRIGEISFGLTSDWKESSLLHGESEQRQSIFARLKMEPYDETRIDASVRLRRDLEAGQETAEYVVSRLWINHHRKTTRSLDARVDASFNHSGSGLGATLGIRESISNSIRLSLAVSGITQSGDGAIVSLVEPVGPGVFPIFRSSTKQIRTSIRADIFPMITMQLWFAARLEQDFDSSPDVDPTTNTVFSLGLEWNDFLP